MENRKIQSFTDLKVWQEGYALVIMSYEVTKQFPKEETYGLTDQMRRAAASVTASVAEGFGRQTYKEKVQFYYIAQGSLTELKNFLLIATDIGYIPRNRMKELSEKASFTHKLLQGLLQKSKSYL